MKVLKFLGIGFGVLLGILIVIGHFVPETSVYIGRQIPNKYMQEIRSLGLISESEQVKYFYTDGLFDIKDGMYFVTNNHLVLYSDLWEEPETIIRLSDIYSIEVDYDDTFINDSMVVVNTNDYEIAFPLSSEYQRDQKFVEFLIMNSPSELIIR